MHLPTKALIVCAFAAVAASMSLNHPNEKLAWYGASGQEPLDGSLPGSPPHPWPDSGNETIYVTLSKNKEYTKMMKAINFVDGIADVLNDSSAHITFFAVPDSALHKPRKPHLSPDLASVVQAHDLSDIVHLVEEFEARPTDDKDDDHKKRCKKFLKKLVRAILSYHILPSKFDVSRLADNSTFATHLVLPDKLGARALRIRVTATLLSPLPTINFYSKVNRPDGAANNGIIHGINHPLLPPPPVFQALFLVPSAFSTFTSAIQRTGLTDTLDLRYKRATKDEKGLLEGAAAVTVFAPSNRAFQALPKKLKLFLFSPFGARVLKKLLQFHIVPDFVFHTDYQYNKTESSSAKPCGHHRTFDISKVGSLGTALYPLQYHASLLDCHGLCDDDSFFWNSPNTDRPSSDNEPSHEDSVHASFVHPAPDLPVHVSLPPGWTHPPCFTNAEQPHHDPISSFDMKLPTALTNHSINAHVEKFNITLPIPGPHTPHKIATKFTVNGHPVSLEDIAGLNGAIHVIPRLLDPRGRHHHPHHRGFIDVDATWEDWEDWLPQWAAEN